MYTAFYEIHFGLFIYVLHCSVTFILLLIELYFIFFFFLIHFYFALHISFTSHLHVFSMSCVKHFELLVVERYYTNKLAFS